MCVYQIYECDSEANKVPCSLTLQCHNVSDKERVKTPSKKRTNQVIVLHEILISLRLLRCLRKNYRDHHD